MHFRSCKARNYSCTEYLLFGEVFEIFFIVSKAVLEYADNIVNLTRESKDFNVGASPRALISLVKAAQAAAYLDGRDFVKPDDIKACAVNVLHHRLVLTSEARIRKENVDRLITTLVLAAKIPMERGL